MELLTINGLPPDLESPEWEYVMKTPAGGLEYYNKSACQVSVKYPNRVLVYKDLRHTVPTARRPYPCDFQTCFYYERL